MAGKKVRRVEAREGYDHWSETYDGTPNPVVAMDARHTLDLLGPKPAEQILDAGCGTGRNIERMVMAGSHPVGIDFSGGMLRVARRKTPDVPLARADLQKPLPLRADCFDAVLCALVGEHLDDLRAVFRELYGVLKPGGRLVFSVYHPEMAAAGIEANFERSGVEFRLGASLHKVDDYMNTIEDAGFKRLAHYEFFGDEALAGTIPVASKYLGFPLLLVIEAKKNE